MALSIWATTAVCATLYFTNQSNERKIFSQLFPGDEDIPVATLIDLQVFYKSKI